MNINGRPITPEMPPYIIAEISGNHRGSESSAMALITAAKFAGADAVKFQCYTPDGITIDHDGPGFVLKEGPWAGRKLYDLYTEAHTPPEWFPHLFRQAKEIGITAFASVFDRSGIELMERLGAPAYKVSSFDLVDIPLIEEISKTNKPIILSTGMADKREIIEARRAIPESHPCLFLHCVSGYPTPVDDAALGDMDGLRDCVEAPVGISDHSLGHDVAVAATALGAVAIEKHLTMMRSDGGPDAEFSMEPREFKAMAEAVRSIHRATIASARQSEAPTRSLRKSLYAVARVSAGSLLTAQNVRVIRPDRGLEPKFYDAVLGKRARIDLDIGSPISWDDLSD